VAKEDRGNVWAHLEQHLEAMMDPGVKWTGTNRERKREGNALCNLQGTRCVQAFM
jgi:hypothetical protein